MDKMIFREARISDIAQMQVVRNSVKENTLSDPAMVQDKDYIIYLQERGKGWVCEIDETIAGFAFADLKENNIWALFVRPENERMGIGKKLHHLMLNWYFEQTHEKVWLGTSPNTRAEIFYRAAGWKEAGVHGKGEIKFEMCFEDWNKGIQAGKK